MAAPIVGENSIGIRFSTLRILEHLGVSRTPSRGFLLCGQPVLILQLAAVEAHSGMIDCRTPLSSE
jgi:hypothetical protein